jgi:hypothetical protein
MNMKYILGIQPVYDHQKVIAIRGKDRGCVGAQAPYKYEICTLFVKISMGCVGA